MTNFDDKIVTNEANKLLLIVGRESAPEEIHALKDAFAGDFEIEINNSYIRLSQDQLPFIVDITIGLVSAGIYDFLKVGIKKLLSSSEITRKKSVVVRKSKEQYIFSEKRICIRKDREDLEFDSVDDLFNYLRK